MYGVSAVWYALTNPTGTACSGATNCAGVLAWEDGTPLQSQTFNTNVNGQVGTDTCGVGTTAGVMGVYPITSNDCTANNYQFFCQGDLCVGNYSCN